MTGFLVAGNASGAGKTTVVLAVTAAMRRRGLAVQVFKGGPDFLDTGHHSRISGRVARNVDTWMLSAEANLQGFARASVGADAVIVEGMMGLFDGKDGLSERGSSAEIAKLLKLPVVLVLDASKSARSVAATVLGFELFDPELELAGVILNRVASERHYGMLAAAIGLRCRTPALGWLAKTAEIAIPERHLGLQTVEETSPERMLEALAEAAEAHLDLPAMMAFTCGLDFTPVPEAEAGMAGVRIGVARDAAFSFYYEDNFDLLREAGAELVPFSPVADGALPEGLDALYLGGGYPELYARELSENAGMLDSVREFAASGRAIYAECGGMIYLGETLTSAEGVSRSMAGVLPCRFEMTPKLVNFGYVTVELTEDCLLGVRGTVLRGHSFHYSRMTDAGKTETCYRVEYSLSKRVEAEGFQRKNILASHVHLHFGAAAGVAECFVQAARAAREVWV